MRSASVQSGAALRATGERLRHTAAVAARKAAGLGRPVLAWVRVQVEPIDPLTIYARSVAAHRTFWARPDEGLALAGSGRAVELTFQGPARFEDAAASWRICVEQSVSDGASAGADEAVDLAALGGFAFGSEGPNSEAWQAFPAGILIVPHICVRTAEGCSTLVVAVAVDPDGRSEIDSVLTELEAVTDLFEGTQPEFTAPPDVGGRPPEYEERPSGNEWKNAVSTAAEAAKQGLFRKVVLARALRVRRVGTTTPAAVAALRAGYPNCAVFATQRGDASFLGATPERLVQIRDGYVSTVALAGSAPRGRGFEDDRRLGEALLRSPKDRLEHAVVVDVLRDVIAEACTDVAMPPAPALLKMANIQHLHTPLAGRLRERLSSVELAGRLHPTPAVGGFPREAALRWIRDHEQIDRGWYAGPVGWIDGRGEGEFAVALRCALLHDNDAVLFAGCGIMADSDPDQEYAESWLKLRPMLSALGIDGA